MENSKKRKNDELINDATKKQRVQRRNEEGVPMCIAQLDTLLQELNTSRSQIKGQNQESEELHCGIFFEAIDKLYHQSRISFYEFKEHFVDWNGFRFPSSTENDSFSSPSSDSFHFSNETNVTDRSKVLPVSLVKKIFEAENEFGIQIHSCDCDGNSILVMMEVNSTPPIPSSVFDTIKMQLQKIADQHDEIKRSIVLRITERDESIRYSFA